MKNYYTDNFEHIAIIEKTKIYPFYGSKTKETAYVLSLYSTYKENRLYYLSTFESMNDALNALKKISCGTFKEI